MATKKAKPDNIHHLTSPTSILSEPVSSLPGVGYSLLQKLHHHKIKTCADLQKHSLTALQSLFGSKTGETLHNFSHGIDTRPLKNLKRRTIGVECNWGVRFENQSQVDVFMSELTKELLLRCEDNNITSAKSITVKLKKRQSGQGEASKFLGCGVCDNFSKMINFGGRLVWERNSIAETGLRVLKEFGVDVEEIRGVGIQMNQVVYEDEKSEQPGNYNEWYLELICDK